MKNKIRVIIVLVVLIAGAYLWSINNTDDVGLIKDKKINVGVILPLTGQYSSIGETDKNAILLAQEELGVDADSIKFYFEDDKYDAKTAVTAYRKLRSVNSIDAVIVLSAPSIQSIAPLTNADNIPLLGLGGTIVYEKDSVFQLMPSGNLLFPTLGKIYGETYKKIAVVHSNADLFAENTRMFRKGLPSDVIAPDFVINSGADMRTEVQKILATQPDVMTVFVPVDDAIKLLKALRVQDQAEKVKIVCDFGTEIAVDKYTEAFGKDRLEGCISANLAETANVNFKDRYKKKYGTDPLLTADYAYDAVFMIQGLTNSTSKSKWIEELSRPGFAFDGTASGKIKFTEDGTRLDLPPTVRIYKDGSFVPYTI